MDGDGFDLNDSGDWAHAICIIGCIVGAMIYGAVKLIIWIV